MGKTIVAVQHVHDRDLDDFDCGEFTLLLRRIEGLALAPEEVMRLEGRIFSDMAEACASCVSKPRCARDLGRSGLLDEDCHGYCPNDELLQAMVDLPWFAVGERTRT